MTNPDTEEWDLRMERAINDLNRNTSKIKQAFLSNEIWKLKMDHERVKMKSDTLEHDLRMHIIDLKMKISELKTEKEQEKSTKEVVWRDACILTTKCQQLEKRLADKDKQIVVLKNANHDLMDLKNQQEKKMKSQYKLVVAENNQLKDMVGDLEASLKTARDGNAKLEDRNAQLCMGLMSDMVANDFKSMLSSLRYHANTSCEAFRLKDEHDTSRDQLGRVINATGETWEAVQSPPRKRGRHRKDIDQLGRQKGETWKAAVQSPPREREPPRKETCLNDDSQGSPELPPPRPSVVRSYAKDSDHEDDATDEESKDASSQHESEDSSDQDDSSDAQPDKRRKF